MGLLQGNSRGIQPGEANVLPGVLDHEVWSGAGTPGRIDIHAIARDLLEQFELARRKLARMLRHIVRVDAVKGFVTLELPMLSSHLAVTPSGPLLPWLRPGRNVPA
ncbi:hypothetical protein D9M71_702790 [compost metagenome]